MPTALAPFPIAFRQMRFDWHRDVPSMVAWAASNGFDGVDLREASERDIEQVARLGLRIGAVDLLDMGRIVDSDPGRRSTLAERNATYIHDLARAGVKVFMTVLMPDDPARNRAENYRIAVDALAPLAEAAASAGAKIAIEGWPGPAPHYPGIGCTPETCRALLRDTDPRIVGINYDPSHLIRLGIDPVRFLREFAGHVWHVHAKDTLLYPDAQYEYGLYQEAAFAAPRRCGQHAWRYTLPGRGTANWKQILAILQETGYPGVISVELEDEEFLATEAEQKAGLIESLAFLRRI